ncbi:50S ribosomal protein L25 [Candidatus Deianiraea vastatrix]|uniref:50S ribosomal protein L25 n=1 Tax=Candidatus Deianiraea vastatrix TaxID=2163644 RepID=A0A5B8XJN7_9RICK|nr:50S ribosomal protein L25 [Candidatus Deianiraea vastatrix]QED23757.1 50S ribosomal protein L25 [Candidatus Deianiraea vastatrix]
MSIILNCVARASIGKSASREVRTSGVLPAVIYTKDGKNLNVLLSLSQIEKLTTNSSFMTEVFTLKIFDNVEMKDIANFKTEISKKPVAEYQVITKDIQFRVNKILHIDLQVVKKGDKIKVAVPVKFVNKLECLPIKFGGYLNVMNYNPKVIAEVGKIPPFIEVDLKGLKSNHIIRLEDILSKLEKGANLQMIKNCDIAKVCGKRGADEPAKTGGDAAK